MKCHRITLHIYMTFRGTASNIYDRLLLCSSQMILYCILINHRRLKQPIYNLSDWNAVFFSVQTISETKEAASFVRTANQRRSLIQNTVTCSMTFRLAEYPQTVDGSVCLNTVSPYTDGTSNHRPPSLARERATS